MLSIFYVEVSLGRIHESEPFVKVVDEAWTEKYGAEM